MSSIQDVWKALESIISQSECEISSEIPISRFVNMLKERDKDQSAGDLTNSTSTSMIQGPFRKLFGGSPKVDADEERGLLDGGEERGGVFRLCKIKDRFTDDGPIGYRDLCLGLEVGWNVKSEGGSLEWVHVQDFETKHVRTHICEVQIMLRSMYEVKASGAHINFVRARNLLCE